MCQQTYGNLENLLDDFSKEFKNIKSGNLDSLDVWNEQDIRDERNDLKKSPSSNETYCSECDDYTVILDRGTFYCNKCGLIINIIIDDTPEWRFYGIGDSKTTNPTRCGYYNNKLLPMSSLGSVISRRYGESYQMRKIRQYHTWNAMPYRERSLYNVFDTSYLYPHLQE